MNSFIPKAPAKQATAPGFGTSHLLSAFFFFGLLLHSFFACSNHRLHRFIAAWISLTPASATSNGTTQKRPHSMILSQSPPAPPSPPKSDKDQMNIYEANRAVHSDAPIFTPLRFGGTVQCPQAPGQAQASFSSQPSISSPSSGFFGAMTTTSAISSPMPVTSLSVRREHQQQQQTNFAFHPNPPQHCHKHRHERNMADMSTKPPTSSLTVTAPRQGAAWRPKQTSSNAQFSNLALELDEEVSSTARQDRPQPLSSPIGRADSKTAGSEYSRWLASDASDHGASRRTLGRNEPVVGLLAATIQSPARTHDAARAAGAHTLVVRVLRIKREIKRRYFLSPWRKC